MGLPKRKLVFQPSIFRCHVSFREGSLSSYIDSEKKNKGFFGTENGRRHPRNWSRSLAGGFVPRFFFHDICFTPIRRDSFFDDLIHLTFWHSFSSLKLAFQNNPQAQVQWLVRDPQSGLFQHRIFFAEHWNSGI